MESELIGEFKGKNTVYRVLPDGVMEVSGQGNGKILGVDAFLATTSIGIMEEGVFSGEVNASITTMAGDTITMQAYAVGYPAPSGNGGVSRAGSTQMTTSDKFMALNKTVLLHEYQTGMDDNWTGKIWIWK
jgi:hypothetical protein